MIVVYIAGPYVGESAWAIEENVRRAEALALGVWRLGAVPICPHTSSRFFYGAIEEKTALDGDLELVSRCDALILVDDWRRSRGARSERAFAEELAIPIFETLDALHAWLNEKAIEAKA